LGLQNQRAEQLHEIACRLVELGGVPKMENELTNMPGIGQYCSDAVRCQAYGEDLPMVDRNAVRVIDRVFSILSRNESPLSEKAAKIVRDFVKNLLPSGSSKEFNIALLDFGALVCRSRKPTCLSCPQNAICNWRSINKRL
jgi:A/G-specific adenine glycosylase